mgnify:CR=1 FL=1
MEKFTFEDIKLIAAEKFSKNEMDVLFSFLSNQINLEKNINTKNNLLLLKAECYQRIGNLKSAQLTLKKIDNKYLSSQESIDANILGLKIAFQSGDWKNSLGIANFLFSKTPPKLMGNVLWRTSMLYAIYDDDKESTKYSNQHKDIIEPNGFQKANNILYTETVPYLITGHLGTSLSKVISPVENAKNIYLSSIINFDTQKKIGSRLKSYCQAILIEAIINYDFSNKYEAYVLSILTGLCMSYSKITLNAEGIGELVKLFKKNYKPLFSILILTINYSEEIFCIKIKSFSDEEIIKRAYTEAIYRFNDIIATNELSRFEENNDHTQPQNNSKLSESSNLSSDQIQKFY